MTTRKRHSPEQVVRKPGQAYVLAGPVPSDYYNSTLFNSTAPGQRVNVIGTNQYLQIRLGHRIAYVNADDVRIQAE